jgi:hypothetical protein
MTERTPDIRLREANSSTWALPTFVLEFAKKVDDPKEIEKKIINYDLVLYDLRYILYI